MAGAAKILEIVKLGPGAPSHRLPWTAGLSSRASPGQSGRGGKGDPAGGWGARVHNVQKKLRKTAPGNASNVKGITNQETYYEPCAAENPGTSKHRKGRGRGGSPEPREDPTHREASETPPNQRHPTSRPGNPEKGERGGRGGKQERGRRKEQAREQARNPRIGEGRDWRSLSVM